MLIIKNNQTVQEILLELKDLSRTKNELRIIVESLPESLDTEIGLDHFLYMLINYPRPIQWVCADGRIFERFQLRGINVEKFNTFSNKTSRALAEIDRLAGNHSTESSSQVISLENTFLNPDSFKRNLNINPIFQKTDTAKNDQSNLIVSGEHHIQNLDLPKQTLLVSKNNSKTLDFASAKTEPIILPVAQTPQNIEIEEEVPIQQEIVKIDPSLELIEIPDNEEVFDLEAEKKSYYQPPSSRQDLDRVRSKIIASKAVLSSINEPNLKIEKPYEPKENIGNLISDQFDHILSLDEPENQPKKANQTKKPTETIKVRMSFWNPIRFVYLFSFVLVVILGGVGLILGLPTVAYTIQVTPEKKENQALFTFEKNFLTQQNYKFDLNAVTDSTGTVSTATSRAKGKVRLLNKTGNNMELTLSKFYLAKDNARYNPVYDSTQVQSISVPSKNNLSGPIVEIEVENGNSDNSGNFDVTEGEELRPVNLQGVPLGPNFTSVVSEAITSNKSQTNKTVAEGDLRTLRSTIESNLLNEKQNKLSEIDNKKYIANINWSTNIESEFNADHKLGDPADKVSMSAKVSSDLYFLDKKLLVDQILGREPTADQVTKIEISNGETAWNKDTQKLSLEVKYIYTLKNDVSKDKLKEIAQNSGMDTTTASSKIKEAYPRISDVKTSVSGIPVPFSPRIEVEVVQNSFSE
jgi:hypothetical protein